MVSRGLVPFRDFWQHHSPLLWVILAPFFKSFKPTTFIFELSRICCVLIFLAIAFLGWKIAKKIWPGKNHLSVYLLILSSAGVLGQFFRLRPDLFMIFFLLCGVFFSLEMTANRLLPVFFAGASFALAASFMFKQYFLFLLPISVIFLQRNKSGILKSLLYLAGLGVGSLPLLIFLIRQDILKEFIFWVFTFNQRRIMVW
jgi:hypothetical protein